ncbi:MAG: hypothetical protein ACXWQ5_06660, partial [Ktedonobacterales bacterium]
EVLIEAHQVSNGEHQWRGRNRTNKLVFFPATRPSSQRDILSSPARGETKAEVAIAEPPVTTLTDVRPGDLVSVLIERTTPWSLQGRLQAR